MFLLWLMYRSTQEVVGMNWIRLWGYSKIHFWKNVKLVCITRLTIPHRGAILAVYWGFQMTENVQTSGSIATTAAPFTRTQPRPHLCGPHGRADKVCSH